MSNTMYTDNKDFQLFLFAGASVSAVAYNGTLMGGLIAPESAHQFPSKQIKHIIGECKSGLYISYQSFGAYIQTTFKSSDFEGAVSHAWGTVSLSVRF